MPLFSIPLSGLSAASDALNVISNNLANLNTVGYKNQDVNFRDLFYQTIGTNGAGSQIQVGAGAALDSISSNFGDGNLQTTGVPTDAAITGEGFFVVENNGEQRYTRAGNFTLRADGALITQNGESVMGYPAVGGQISTSQGLAPMLIAPGQTSPANPSSIVRLNVNLDASTAVNSSSTPNFTTPVRVYDSLGTPHDLTFQFTKTGANTWSYKVSVPGADVGASTTTDVATGTLDFDASGKLVSPTTAQRISIGPLSDGAGTLGFDWQMMDPNGNATLSQVAAPSSTSSTFQDGYNSGTLRDFSITQDGTIQGTFSNGRSMAIGQIALATFSNPQGLQRIGGNEFQTTLASGAAAIGAPGSGGRGTISGGTLEQSNVDIAQEFSTMIVTQRGFQANARVITTFDEVTQDTINLKR